jgi:hypothetical protein
MPAVRLRLVVPVFAVVAALGVACGSATDNPASFGNLGDASVSTGDGGNVLVVNRGPDGGGFIATPTGDGGDASTALVGPLVLTPMNGVIDVVYGQQTPGVTYTATIAGQTVPASFSIDRGEIGSIAAATGVLTPAGFIGGTANVTATYGAQTISTQVTVSLHFVQNGGPVVPDGGAPDAGASDAAQAGDAADTGTGEAGTSGVTNAGGNGGVGGEGIGGPVPSATVTVLQGTPSTDASLGWLYPYDGTVWPRGLLAPLLQWTTQLTYDAVSIHVSEAAFDFQGYFSATATPFVHHPIPEAAWDALGYSNQGESVTITLVFSSGGVAYGPLTETWKFAQATLSGTVYYNSYGTNLAHNLTQNGVTFGGATLAIKHGATDPVLVAGNDSECRVCHSVSADGSRLVTQQQTNAISSTYDLTNGYAETVMSPGDSRFAWAGLYPDGTFLITDGARGSGAAPTLQGGGWNGDAQLFGLPDGGAVASTGIPAGLRMGSPVFSPDGNHVAFNFYAGTVPAPAAAVDTDGGTDAGTTADAATAEAGTPGDAGTDGGAAFVADGVSLAIMDYAVSTSTFSNFRILFTPPSGYSVWPSFLPTNDAVVFELETHNNGRDWGGTRSPCDSTACASQVGTQAEIWWVDIVTGKASRLDELNGKQSGVGYLPTLAANLHTDDTILNYEPTSNPVPGGGYAWIVFTSRRLYGNIATIPPYWSDPRYVNLTSTPTPKKLWVAALDLTGTPGTDVSHPAFYLPGQELLAGNSRGYWVVDPCEPNGTTCATGDQCCGGYCEDVDGGFVCSAAPPACSNLNDKCTTASSCCGVGQGTLCINNRCAEPVPPVMIPPTVQ